MALLQERTFTCITCFEYFSSETAEGDKRPYVVCNNGHSLCGQCATKVTLCPSCRSECLNQFIINRALLDIIEERNEALGNLPGIPSSEITPLECRPLGSGACADVFACKWSQQKVAVKYLRLNPLSDQMKALRKETGLAISLLHPNIVRVYGTTEHPEGKIGIVMELAERGTLSSVIQKKLLDLHQKVKVSQDILDGVAFLHGKNVGHRDLKPENILLFGLNSHLTAKISDFGISRLIQASVTNTAMIGTPRYTAPELLQAGQHYSCSADIYSVSIILYELFTSQSAFPECSDLFQIITAILIHNKRPDIPPDFDVELADVIKRGWSAERKNRPFIKDFHQALNNMCTSIPAQTQGDDMITRERVMNASDQVAEVVQTALPLPMLGMRWAENCEEGQSVRLRKQMVEDLKTASNLKDLITPSVLKVMEVVPRHLFMEPSRMEGQTQEEKIKMCYRYKSAMAATKESNESSPEIIGIQLSLVTIHPGAKVLLVGSKGGYIGSVVAQMVGVYGTVINISSNSNLVNICRERVTGKSPLAQVIRWICLENLNSETIYGELQPLDFNFHSIIYCGAIASMPDLLVDLLEDGGTIMAPVKVGDKKQQIQCLQKINGNERELRKLISVRFEDVK